MTDEERERGAIARWLQETGLDRTAWPHCVLTTPMDARVGLSALLVVLDSAPGRPGYDEALDRLRRRRLPWDRATAALAVDLVMRSTDFDGTRVGVALRGAEAVCVAGEADTALLDRLARCQVWLDEQSAERWAVPQMRLLVRRALAAAAPPALLDLSLVVDGDGWGVVARQRAHDTDPAVAAPLVRRLGELGPRKPSQRWLRAVEEAVRPDPARQLVRAWLELAAYTPVVEPDETRTFSGGMLLAPSNEDLVRASVLVTPLLPEEPWVPELLGVLARRGAAASHVPGMTAALSLKVASAAVDALAARGTPADRSVLEELLVDLARRDLVKRVGEALGREAEAGEREVRLRREKAAAVRSKADPGPREARAAIDRLLRRHLGPTLRGLGFRAGGRTWRRLHDDRVDVIFLGSGDDEISVGYGTRFDAAHPDDEPYPEERTTISDYHLDIRLREKWGVSPESLDRCARRLEVTVVPFLDTLGRYELARAYLEHLAGAPPGADTLDNPGSPAVRGVLGLLAYAAGDRPTAVEQLADRVGFAEEQDADVTFWRRRLDLAHRLPAPGA